MNLHEWLCLGGFFGTLIIQLIYIWDIFKVHEELRISQKQWMFAVKENIDLVKHIHELQERIDKLQTNQSLKNE